MFKHWILYLALGVLWIHHIESVITDEEKTSGVSQVCLGCICEAVTKCDGNRGCDQYTCGLFKMTKAFWSDAGEPTLVGESASTPKAFEHCAKDIQCAANAIRGYMNVYEKDCNGDGVIDCEDHMRIHWHGASGCSKRLPTEQGNQFKRCIAANKYYERYFDSVDN